MKVKIEKLDNYGRGICYLSDKITFVPNALENEVVDIEIISNKSKYNVAKVIDFIEISSKRKVAKCPYYNECGGCNLLHMSYENMLDFKKKKVKDVLLKYANLEVNPEIVPSKSECYRNKVTLKVQDKRIGYYEESSHKLVEIKHCLLLEDAINKFLDDAHLLGINNGEIIIRTNYNNELLINIKTEDKLNIPVETLKENHKIVGILINGKIVSGEDHFLELVNQKFFQNGYESFFQVNRDINTAIFKYLDAVLIPKGCLLDLYCGVGTLGLNVANKFDKVYGIEINSDAIKNALINKKINMSSNVIYMLGDAKEVLPKIKDKITTAIVDPPRSGLDINVVETLINLDLEQLVYISCDAITLARDLKFLVTKYKLEEIKLFDMFPGTYHVETVVTLKRCTNA